jgi:flagellum-specific ATP synthase
MPGHHEVTGTGLAEVVGFSNDRAFLMPAGDVHGLSSGATVEPAPAYVACATAWRASSKRRIFGEGVLRLPLGDGLLGRVVDAQGTPMDYLGPIQEVSSVPMDRKPINAMDRAPVRESLDTGIRAINALLTVGRGQRLGLFAGSGVGKSVLLGMMARYTRPT